MYKISQEQLNEVMEVLSNIQAKHSFNAMTMLTKLPKITPNVTDEKPKK